MGMAANVWSALKRLLRMIFTLGMVPIDLLRVTGLFMILTVRFAGRFYLYLLSALPEKTRPGMEFLLCRPRHSPVVWDDELRFIVRRELTLKIVSFFCGLNGNILHPPDPDLYVFVKIRLSACRYLRLALLTGLMWGLLAGAGLAFWRPAFLIRADRSHGRPHTGLSRRQVRAAGFTEEAEQLHEKGDYKRARIQFLNAVQLMPSSITAQWGLAQCELQLNQLSEARRALGRVVALDPSHQEARAALIDLLLRQGKARQAIRYAIPAVDMDPADIEAIVRLGKCRQLLDHLPEANALAETALNLSPNHPGALILAAAIAADTGNCPAARQYIGRVMAAVPEAELDRLVVARILGTCGDYPAALAQIRKLLEQNPSHWIAAQEKAELLLAGGDIDAAIWEYQKLARHDAVDASIPIRLAELLLASGRLDEAHQIGESLVRRIPHSKVGHLVLAMVYYQKGLYISCAEQCRACLEREPDSVAGRLLLARALMQQKEFGKAARWLKELRAKDRQNYEVLLMLAECHVARRENKKALQALVAAVALQPDSETPYLLRARVHLENGNFGRAHTAYEKALELDPQDVLALNNMAMLLSSPGTGITRNLSKALKLATTAWGLQPGNPEIAETLGWIYALRSENVPAFYLLSYAARQQPYKAEIRLHLAHVLAGLKRYQEASSQLDLAQELLPALSNGLEFKALRRSLALETPAGEARP